MDPRDIAGAILRGIKAATSSTSLHFLTDIHLVMIKIDTFLAFKEKATQMFLTPINRGDASIHNFLFWLPEMCFRILGNWEFINFCPTVQRQTLHCLMNNNNSPVQL